MKILNRTSTLGMAAILFACTSTIAQEHDDADHVLEVERAIPEFMIQGPHHRVVSPVVNRFALDEFNIETDVGASFEAIGQLQLRIRLREIYAIAALQSVAGSTVARDAAVREGRKTITAVAQVGRHPIRSAKGLASGIGQRFRKWTRDVVEDAQIAMSSRSGAEKRALLAERWLGVDESRRRIAGELNIDPYTDNTLLRDELDLVARADAGANIGAKLLIPRIPVADIMRNVHSLVTTRDYRQLLDYNRKRLQQLGVPAESITLLLESEHFNPTAVSLLISLIVELDGVQNQVILFDQALASDSSIDGLFLIESIAMAVWYHQNETPLMQVYLTTGLPAGRDSTGQLVVFAATDFPHWTHVQADVVRQLDFAYKPFSASPMLMLAGNASGEFRSEVSDLGWQIRYNVRNEYLPSLPWAATDEEFRALQD